MRVAGLDLPHLAEDHRLRRVLRGALRARQGPPAGTPAPDPAGLWEAGFFGLSAVSIFRDLGEEARRQALATCARSLLEEAFFVEKSGIGYAARMTLESETTEERMLYGLIGAEEAGHLAMLQDFLPEADVPGPDDPFLRFLADLIEDGPRPVLLLVVQVVLEGWGLTHYRGLAEGCRHPGLARCLEQIVRDEARHHGTGVILFEAAPLSPADRALAIETLDGFLAMVRVGPQRVVAALERAAGHLSRDQRLAVFRELDTEAHSARRLAVLRGLLESEAAAPLAAALAARGAFTPAPPEACL